MQQDHIEKHSTFRKRCRRLWIALGLSCFLNISLLAFGLYEWQDAGYSFLATSSYRPQKSKLFRQSGKDLPTLTQGLRELEALEYDSLVAMLSDESPVAEGYKKQDIALSMLICRHYFDVGRAMGSCLPDRRLFTYMPQDGQPSEIILYPDLPKEQLAAVAVFAKNEKYPFTPQGLLARYKQEQNEDVKDLYFQTGEYRCVELLLTRKTPLTRDEIFDLVLNIDYSLIKNLYNEMLKAQDFSPEVRRGFLLTALPHSALLLFKTDSRFCVHSLADKQVDSLLSALAKNPDLAQEYALGLLEGPRSKAVWNKSVRMLCEKLQLDPQIEDRNSLLERFGRIKPEVKAAPVALAAAQKEVKPEGKIEPVKKELSMPAPKPAIKPLAKPQKPATAAPAAKPTATVKPVDKTVAPKPLAAKPAPAKPVPARPASAPKAPPQKISYEVVHVVQTGDTLWQLSKRYGVDIDIIKKHNKLSSDALKPGSTLRIPQNPKPK